MKLALCLPTLNASGTSKLFLDAFACQNLVAQERLVVDSQSNDGTSDIFSAAGFRVHTIPRNDFNHGRTRQLAVDLCSDADIIIFMTQDAILANSDSIGNLVESFSDPVVGAAYGRQLPEKNALPIAAHARLFNYPPESRKVSRSDIYSLGVKAAFLSNSFAAYRREALQSVGGFPDDVIFGEDTCVAAKILQNDWKIAYCSEAKVFHSHNYSMLEEFRRYFDVGVFHSREKWFVEFLGRAEGEGKRFVLSELKYLFKIAPWLIPSAVLRTFCKFAAYKLGGQEGKLPLYLCKKLSMNTNYWS